MFKLRLAEYINSNMLERGMTYKTLHERSGVPGSTLHAYAQAKVTAPDEENLVRIAAAFGDPPEIIQRMRRESLEATTAENKLIAQSTDKERMEQFAALIRSSVAALLEEYRVQAAAQQTEILEHADRRVEEDRRRFKARAEEVLRQCNEEVARTKAYCDEKIEIHKEHYHELHQEAEKRADAAGKESERVRAYLKRVIRNLSIALVIVSVLSSIGLAAFGGYAFYAYQTFDREDPTRGLYRAAVTPEPSPTPFVEEP